MAVRAGWGSEGRAGWGSEGRAVRVRMRGMEWRRTYLD